MGIGKLIEEVGGAIAAEQAAEAVDPNAGILVKGAAVVAGFMGVGKLSEALESHAAAAHPAAAAPAPAAMAAPADAHTDTDADESEPEPK